MTNSCPKNTRTLALYLVGDILSREVDIVLAVRDADHASVTTIARYDRRPDEAKCMAANLLHYPFEASHNLIISKQAR